ncbi:MAG: hypothetical protein GAK45_01474 [Pseudomonas citronellolis]|nr:MAG: hypothetical protein GAK45_01474 [Pseudomonas citronellolis]
MTPLHLAQVNLAWTRASLDHPSMLGFVEQLERINALAERSDGFIWRLQDEQGDATALRAFDDERIIVNLSLWRDVAALHRFVYSGDHLAVLRRKREWMERPNGPHLALWWVPAGHRPTLDEACTALRRLASDGPGPQAFTLARPFAPALPA